MKELKVIKKNGRVVDFKPKKIYKACRLAGASDKVAKRVASSVVNDLHKIKTKTIRAKTLEKLRELDKEVADNWLKYDIEHAKANEKTILKL